jgi:hypothetical protein
MKAPWLARWPLWRETAARRSRPVKVGILLGLLVKENVIDSFYSISENDVGLIVTSRSE